MFLFAYSLVLDEQLREHVLDDLGIWPPTSLESHRVHGRPPLKFVEVMVKSKTNCH